MVLRIGKRDGLSIFGPDHSNTVGCLLVLNILDRAERPSGCGVNLLPPLSFGLRDPR